jgi:hypothetical protein
MRILNALREWWARPPAIERIYAAAPHSCWITALDLKDRAGIFSIGRFYVLAERLESQGKLISVVDAGPIPAARRGYRRKLYRRVAP